MRVNCSLIIETTFREKFGERCAELEIGPNRDGPPIGLVNIRVQGIDDANVVRATDDLYAWLQQESAVGKSLEGVFGLSHDGLEQDRAAFAADKELLARHDMTPLAAQIFGQCI